MSALAALPGAGATALDAVVRDPAPFVVAEGEHRRLDLLVRGARCGGCLRKIEDGVGALEGVVSARFNLSNGRLRVEWRGRLAPDRILATLAGLGFPAVPYAHDAGEAERVRTERRLLIALAVAGFASANIMLLSVPVWTAAEISPETRDFLHWVSALIAFPAVLFAGRPFFSSALAGLRARRLNMDAPISLAVVLALSISLYETSNGGEHAYFDAAATLLFFLLIGRFLDARLRRRAYAAANALAGMQSASATRIEAGGARAVRLADVRPGDRILLSTGEQLGVDARLLSPLARLDLRLVTGESEPVEAAAGRRVHAGAINLGAPAEVEALAPADRSLMADVAAMLEAGEQKRSRYRRLADRAAELYVPRVHGLALLGFVGWLIAGAGLAKAGFIATTVLIITCPCALALAAPVVQVVAAGRLFREGVFLASGDALERLAEVDHVVFDKTGTLTLGEPVLASADVSPPGLEAAAHLARASRHPLARALARAAGPGPVAERIEEHPGRGVSGVIAGEPARLGSAAFVGTGGPGGVAGEGGGRLWFRRGDQPPVSFAVEDVIRPDASRAIADLARLGCTSEIVSGDAAGKVEAAARAVGVGRWTAGAAPAEKAQRLEVLARDGRKVLMVGDGLNDAGALALAHASIAPGGAVDVARLTADCVFSGDSLLATPRILAIARTARRRMRENFTFAAVYNLLAVPIALAGFATPMVAAIAMSGSSLVVTLNALRMARPAKGGRGA